MPLATDLPQRVDEAIVVALDTKPALVALTGRANVNIVPWEDETAAPSVGLAFLDIATANWGGTGDTRRATRQISAFAPSKDKANALLEVVEKELTTPALQAAGLDAFVEGMIRRGAGGSSEEGTYVRHMDVTIVASK